MNGPIPNRTKGCRWNRYSSLRKGRSLRYSPTVSMCTSPQPAPVEIARSRMMNGVVLAPAVVRRHRQDGESSPERIIGGFGFEERAVPAIVLQDEQPDEESRSGKCQGEDEQIRVSQAEPHQGPQHAKRDDRRRQLRQASAQRGLTVRTCEGAIIGRSRCVVGRSCVLPRRVACWQ